MVFRSYLPSTGRPGATDLPQEVDAQGFLLESSCESLSAREITAISWGTLSPVQCHGTEARTAQLCFRGKKRLNVVRSLKALATSRGSCCVDHCATQLCSIFTFWNSSVQGQKDKLRHIWYFKHAQYCQKWKAIVKFRVEYLNNNKFLKK